MNQPKPLFLIVSSSLDAPGAVLLKATAEQQNLQAEIVVIGSEGLTARIHSADYIVYRIGPKSYNLYAELLETLEGAPKIQLAHMLKAFDKAETHDVLFAADIAIPRTWQIDRSYAPTEFPFIVKITRGNQGLGVELINSTDDFQTFLASYEGDVFVAQEFIAEAAASDKRLFVVGDTVVAAMQRRSASDDFRANLHLGGSAEAYTPTDTEVSLALASLTAFDIDFAGVDIIDSERGPLVLEVNPSPGFGIAEITGIDVATEVVTYVTRSK